MGSDAANVIAIEELTTDYLRRQDTVLAAVLNSLFDGVYIVDRRREILFWNRGAEQITGFSAAEVAGRLCQDEILSHIDEEGRLMCHSICPLMQSMRSGRFVEAKIYPRHKSGRRFPVRTHVAPIRDKAGEIIAAIEVFRDVSRDEEFRLLQEKFNQIVQRYVSTSTYEEIVAQAQSGAAGAARRRDLSIMYMDIVGFTSLTERSAPEEVVKILNDFFGLCGVITTEHHGDIDKFIGDTIMAVFIDANDAVEAAMKILQIAIPDFNRQRGSQGLDPIQIRIGVNSGPVLEGDVGANNRKDRTVIGDVVNTAQRVERLCRPDSILITEGTYARLRIDNAHRFEFQQEAVVKGKGQPVRVFALRERPI